MFLYIINQIQFVFKKFNKKYVDGKLQYKIPRKIKLQIDEMCGRVYSNQKSLWLWHTINHKNDDVISYIIGSGKDKRL